MKFSKLVWPILCLVDTVAYRKGISLVRVQLNGVVAGQINIIINKCHQLHMLNCHHDINFLLFYIFQEYP